MHPDSGLSCLSLGPSDLEGPVVLKGKAMLEGILHGRKGCWVESMGTEPWDSRARPFLFLLRRLALGTT